MEHQHEAIAIVGMTGRFPGARNLDEFWRNIAGSVESVKFFSNEELLADGIDPALLQNPDYIRAKGFLEDGEMFDAAFFGLNPREAEIIDPQHRLFLQAAYNALESASCDPERFDGSIAVYAGLSMNTYVINNLVPNPDIMGQVGFYQAMLANDKDFMTTRASYKLNLKGPSVLVQTACSTSLVAVQMACQALLTYQCDMALAGGVSLYSPRHAGYLYQPGMIMSPDGHCRAFDADGQGIVAGEGVGIVVLKRLSQAIADGDTIHAVIRGAAINNDGSVKVGYTAPSVGGQAEVIAMAQAMAGVEPDTIDYIECHGTGTPLGDPIELGALTQVFRAETDRKQFCAIGSVKTNIGHLDSAAGVAGLIKAVLALRNRQIPPSINFSKPNPQIDFENSPFYVNTQLRDWPAAEDRPRRAGVSSFGIGGTNVHVVLEEAPDECGLRNAECGMKSENPQSQIVVISAKSSAALEEHSSRITAHLEAHPELNLADVAYSLQTGRQAFAHRRMVVAEDVADAARALADPRRAMTSVAQTPQVVFMFTGQGAQYGGMGRGLYEREPVFRDAVVQCAELLKPALGLDIREPMFSTLDQEDSPLNQTRLAQPALFTIEYAMCRLLEHWGIKPQAMIGHSIGEYAAACNACVFTLEDALAIVAERGRLMQSMPRGAMMSVTMSDGDLRNIIGPDVSIAAVNAPGMTVVSGPAESLDKLTREMKARGAACRMLHTSHAYHSAMMEPILAPFEAFLRKFEMKPPAVPFVSNLTGTWIRPEEATSPAYWARHLRQTVWFAKGIQTLAEEPGRVLLEVGPGQTLCMLTRQQQLASRPVIVSAMRHINEQEADRTHLLNSIGKAWLAGVNIDWQAMNDEKRRRLPLPEYPFEAKRYWVDPPRQTASKQKAADLEKRSDIMSWFYMPGWKRTAPAQVLASLASAESAAPRQWLIFSDERGLGIDESVTQSGDAAVTVAPADRFEQVGPNRFTVKPDSAADYVALMRALDAAGGRPERVVHAWNVLGAELAKEPLDACDMAQGLGYYSLLYLVQATQQVWPREPWQLDVLTNGLQEVVGESIRVPERATLLGLARTLPNEMPFIRTRCIDLPWDAEKETESLLEELDAVTAEPVVALRGACRWVRNYESVPLSHAEPRPPRIKEHGVYLITGGLGDIGLALAGHLARVAHARLVLVGRSPLPARDDWPNESHDARTRERINAVRALEEAGAEVLVCAAEMTNADQVRAAVSAARDRFGRIDGVIHAAGIPGGGIIALRTAEQSARVMGPKLQGTFNLEAALGDEPLDFFIMTSSVASIFGWIGQVDYTAANIFLDHYAHYRRDRGYISVNWDNWQQIGIAVKTEVTAQLQSVKEWNLARGIATAEGIEAFDRILARPMPQVVVSTIDFGARQIQALDLVLDHEADRTVSETAAKASPTAEPTPEAQPQQAMNTHPRPDLANAYVAPRTDAEQAMARIWETLLGISPVGAFDSFFELGGHSLLAVQVISRLQKQFQVDLPLRSLFEAPTVAGLTECIETARWAAQGRKAEVGSAGGDREEFEL